MGTNPAKEVQAEGFSVREALDRVGAAARDGLAGGPLDRDAFHQALRERLPAGLLPWCRGCQSHHVRPGLWRALGPLGVTEMPEKATYALATGPAMALDDAREELARRFLRCYGPATHSHLASWGQTAPAHAKALLGMIEDELEAVKVGGSRRWILAADAGRLEAPPPARGIRLLGGFDPYVAQPDRDALVPDPTIRKKLVPARRPAHGDPARWRPRRAVALAQAGRAARDHARVARAAGGPRRGGRSRRRAARLLASGDPLGAGHERVSAISAGTTASVLTMRLTTKGQVTIPQELRERFGLSPGSEVEVVAGDDGAVVRPLAGRTRGAELVARLRDSGDSGMAAEAVLRLTRGA